MIDQVLAAPVRAALPFFQVSDPSALGSCGIGSQVHLSLPLAASIEAADFAARLVGRAIIGDAGADNNGVGNHGWWGGFFVVGEVPGCDAKSLPQVHDADVAEIFAWVSRRCVDRNQARIDRCHQDSKLPLGRRPCGDAAVGEIPVPFVSVDLRLIRPALLTGHGIERDNSSQRSAQIKCAVDV